MQDLYASNPLASSTLPASALVEIGPDAAPRSASNTSVLLPRPSDDEIADDFSRIHPLKYSQEHQPVSSSNAPPLEALTITAYPAGHTIGGTIWHIRYGSESVVYAVDWNQARENVMSGAGWLGGGVASGSEVIEQLRQPTALVCSSKRPQVEAMARNWRARDDQLLSHIRESVQTGATVLIPCDTSARVLEMAYFLERAWTEDAELRRAKLCMATHQSDATMKYARSMLEWMDESVVKDFESQVASRTIQGQAAKGTQPFDFKFLKLLERKSQVSRSLASSGSKVFLATSECLDWGFSRDILESMRDDRGNLIILPTKPGTICSGSERSLIDMLSAKLTDENKVVQLDESLDVSEATITPLGLDEAAVYQHYLTRQRQRQDASSVSGGSGLETTADALEDRSSSSSSEDEDEEQQGRMLNTSTTMQHSKRKFGLTDEELGISILIRRKGAHDYDVRGKKGRERMFPFVAKRKRNDDFGDLIRPEDYLRAEEVDDMDTQRSTLEAHKSNTQIGQKRRLDGRSSGPVNGIQIHGGKGSHKRRRSSENAPARRHDDDDTADKLGEGSESEESDYEPAEPIMLGPQKVSFAIRALTVKTKLVAVDYGGLHDKRALQNLLPLINPRSLILTAGSSNETRMTAVDCERLLGLPANKQRDSTRPTRIYTPVEGESVDASVDINAWSLRLSRNLVKTLRWQSFRQLGVATVDGHVQNLQRDELEDGAASKRLKLEENDIETKDTVRQDSKTTVTDIIPVLNELSTGAITGAASFAQSIHVGDLRLAELRRLLKDRGHTAEFKGEGTLLVDDYIAIRKSGIGKIEIESGGGFAVSSSFGIGLSEVKQKIYEGLAVVAAR